MTSLKHRCVLSFCLVFCLVATTSADDLINTIRDVHPSFLEPRTVRHTLLSIDWQLKQNERLMQNYKDERDDIKRSIEKLSHSIEALTDKLPADVRFIDPRTRSQLVGDVLKDMYDAKLELATKTLTIASLERRLEDDSARSESEQLKEVELKAALEQAELRLEHFDERLSRAKILTEKVGDDGITLSQAELERQTAESELQIARARVRASMNAGKSRIASKLADLRLEVEPAKAKIAAATEFLDMFTQANEIVSAIDQTQRELELWQSDLKAIAAEMTAIGRRVTELEVLKRTIESEMKGAEKSDN